MNKFKNTKSYQFGVICGYIYVLSVILLVIFKNLTDLGILKTTGYWGIFEHPDTFLSMLVILGLFFISLFILPNIGLGLFLYETMQNDIPETSHKENAFLEIINSIFFILYAWITVLILIAGCFTPPFIPLIIIFIYFILRFIKRNKNV